MGERACVCVCVCVCECVARLLSPSLPLSPDIFMHAYIHIPPYMHTEIYVCACACLYLHVYINMNARIDDLDDLHYM